MNSIKHLLINNKENQFNIYTDGACKFINKKLQMAIGIIIGPQKKRDPITISAKYINILLISAAELATITIAISIIPKNSKIKLHTDSQITINTIKKFLYLLNINKK